MAGTPQQQPPKNYPKECKDFTPYTGTCYTGPIAKSLLNSTLATCCGAATASNPGQSALFNFFASNATCHLLSSYVSTTTCDGMLGYSVPAGGGGGAGFETLFYRALCRGSPSVMWSFPRAGNNPNNTWTRDDVLITTKTKAYTAYDMKQLLEDLHLDASVLAQLAFLEQEPDLHGFAAPGVDTFVSYGSGTLFHGGAGFGCGVVVLYRLQGSTCCGG
eukprot:m.89443 g.89443  ORF g.89443 m.89443 type:complete len:218 (-) comp16438_c0_seq16:677-1330(-)